MFQAPAGRIQSPAHALARTGGRDIRVDEGRRSERVAEMVLRELSTMLVRELKDPRLRGVTLTRVRMDTDLRHGRVFFSHLEGAARAAGARAGFKSAAGFIRREIGHRLKLRYIPELNFEFDPGIEQGARVSALLRASASKP